MEGFPDMTMTKYLSVLVAFGVVAGCDREPEDLSRSLDLECQAKYDARAEALITQYGACEVDADCTLIFSECLLPLACGTPTARATASELEEATGTLISEYIAECGNFCSLFDCADLSTYHPTCDGATGLCTSPRNEPAPGAQQP
jgi:hypothetical protein